MRHGHVHVQCVVLLFYTGCSTYFDAFIREAFLIYATLAYIRHFTFAGCYDNNLWYLVTNLAGHLDLAGFYFLKVQLILNALLNLLLGYSIFIL